jgi:hypothetical protein
MYEEVAVKTYVSLISALVGDKWSASSTGLLLPGESSQ